MGSSLTFGLIFFLTFNGLYAKNTVYHVNSLSCKRYQGMVLKNVAECELYHPVHKFVYCYFMCKGEYLEQSNCHLHKDKTDDYPSCIDMFCSNVVEVVTCNEPKADKFAEAYGSITNGTDDAF